MQVFLLYGLGGCIGLPIDKHSLIFRLRFSLFECLETVLYLVLSFFDFGQYLGTFLFAFPPGSDAARYIANFISEDLHCSALFCQLLHVALFIGRLKPFVVCCGVSQSNIGLWAGTDEWTQPLVDPGVVDRTFLHQLLEFKYYTRMYARF